MSVKTSSRAKVQKLPAVTTTGIRTTDLPKLEKLSAKLGMKKVEYLARVLDRDEQKPFEQLAGELVASDPVSSK